MDDDDSLWIEPDRYERLRRAEAPCPQGQVSTFLLWCCAIGCGLILLCWVAWLVNLLVGVLP